MGWSALPLASAGWATITERIIQQEYRDDQDDRNRLGKSVFHMIGMDDAGTVVLKKRCSRSQLVEFMANLAACVVAMEACCGSHHLGRKLADQGHTVRLIPAQFVRPFVKSNKNDFVDAEAIAEAVQRPTMRFVTLKSEDQLDVQALHRV